MTLIIKKRFLDSDDIRLTAAAFKRYWRIQRAKDSQYYRQLGVLVLRTQDESQFIEFSIQCTWYRPVQEEQSQKTCARLFLRILPDRISQEISLELFQLQDSYFYETVGHKPMLSEKEVIGLFDGFINYLDKHNYMPTKSKEMIREDQEMWEMIPDTGWDRQMLKLWLNGFTAPEIGERIDRAEKTIRNRLTALRREHGDEIVPYKQQWRKMKK